MEHECWTMELVLLEGHEQYHTYVLYYFVWYNLCLLNYLTNYAYLRRILFLEGAFLMSVFYLLLIFIKQVRLCFRLLYLLCFLYTLV